METFVQFLSANIHIINYSVNQLKFNSYFIKPILVLLIYSMFDPNDDTNG